MTVFAAFAKDNAGFSCRMRRLREWQDRRLGRRFASCGIVCGIAGSCGGGGYRPNGLDMRCGDVRLRMRAGRRECIRCGSDRRRSSGRKRNRPSLRRERADAWLSPLPLQSERRPSQPYIGPQPFIGPQRAASRTGGMVGADVRLFLLRVLVGGVQLVDLARSGALADVGLLLLGVVGGDQPLLVSFL